MNSSFLKTLTEAVNGVTKLEDCAKAIAADCIDDLLLRISNDYSLDFSQLVEKYKDDVVERHATMSVERHKCMGKTTSGKSCSRFAVCGGYCRAHKSQGEFKKKLDDDAGLYSTTQIKKKNNIDIMKNLAEMGIEHVDIMSMKASKKVIEDFFE